MSLHALLILDDTNVALTHLAGMSLLRRAQLTMRHLGAEHVLLLSSREDEVALEKSEEGVAAYFSRARERAALLEEGVDAIVSPAQWRDLLDSHPGARWLVARADHVYDKNWKAALASNEREVRHGALVMAHGYELLARMEDGELAAELAQPTSSGERPFTADASHSEGAALAKELLWESCRKDIDGVVSRHFNRHVSLAISRRLVDRAIHPNHITVLNMIVGLMSGWFALSGDYGSVLIGAALLQANSVLDGVDGELARVRWQFSKFGARFDYLGDNIANFSFFGALCVAMYRAGEVGFAQLGALCLAMWVSYVGYQYMQLFITEKGSPLELRFDIEERASGALKICLDFLRGVVLRRDGFVFMLLVLAALDQPELLIVLMSLGAAIPFAGMILHYPIKICSALARRS